MLRTGLIVVLFLAVSAWSSPADRLAPPIVGGFELEIGQVPYQISMRLNNRHRCGGSIFSDHVIVTAAHCLSTLSSAKGLSIVAGSTTLTPMAGQQIDVARFIVHPKYVALNKDYDVAIMILKGQLKFNELVKPIALAKDLPKDGTHALVSGWGHLVEGGAGGTPNHLYGAEIELFPLSRCKKNYLYMTTSRMICAGVNGGGIDACQGDSGGPLVTKGELIGIVSWGNGCARETHPGLYSSVPVLYPWIFETIRNNSINLA